jgi:endonuclease/exonuclease/phosphatase family metal-dependent hydrolase
MLSEGGRTKALEFSVLTYNIEGLPWPIRKGRSAKLREIGERLLADVKAGNGPDIVLIQEAFSAAAVRAVMATGYPNIVGGPGRTQRRTLASAENRRGAPNWLRGELGIRLTSSGLIVASRYPITRMTSEPFGKSSCAGFDCLSNKGKLLASIAIPGVPFPIEVVNTHMNAQGASRVPTHRYNPAHRAQSDELLAFLTAYRDPQQPLILGGDFNMRGSSVRFSRFQELHALELAHRECIRPDSPCEVLASWDGDEPWMDTQDLQLFASATAVHIIPVRIETMFDGRLNSPALSDHDGLLVTYRVSWSADLSRVEKMDPHSPGCAAPRD